MNHQRGRQTIPATIKRKRGVSKAAKGRQIISTKFCRCVKKLERQFGPRAIGICTNSVFGTKGLRRVGTFKCKPNHVQFRPMTARELQAFKRAHGPPHTRKQRHR